MTEVEPTAAVENEGPSYQAPALEKGLDILELLAQASAPMSRPEISRQLGRTVGEIYRMLHILAQRDYIVLVGDSYVLTTKLFELSHRFPPMQRLLIEATPVMHQLASSIDQSCHLTVYSQGRQMVIAKVDVPSGMGFSVRVGSELSVLVSASGRVLLAFQADETRQQRIAEAQLREPTFDIAHLDKTLAAIVDRGFEAAPSGQVRGLFAISYPILDLSGHAIAALTVPYADRIDRSDLSSISDVEAILREATKDLTARVSGG